ncbi:MULTISPECIES: hypothetical protein [Clostridium]|uniref:Sulfurtransferase TusA family protein n=1 Tax=Clostridium lapidicellarium TaxID=3240931 RepID=A0ABV4DVY8_9CLOT
MLNSRRAACPIPLILNDMLVQLKMRNENCLSTVAEFKEDCLLMPLSSKKGLFRRKLT